MLDRICDVFKKIRANPLDGSRFCSIIIFGMWYSIVVNLLYVKVHFLFWFSTHFTAGRNLHVCFSRYLNLYLTAVKSFGLENSDIMKQHRKPKAEQCSNQLFSLGLK